MASVLDLGLIEYFLPAFTFLFVFVLSYAILDKFKLLGDNKGVKLVAAFSLSTLIFFSSGVVELINKMTPWFFVFVIFTMFIIALFMFMGVKEDSIVKTVGSTQVVWTVIIIAIILFIVALVQVFGDVMSPYNSLEEDTGSVNVNTVSSSGGTVEKTRGSESMKTLVNPKVLGVLFLLVISALAVSSISKGLN